MAIRDRGNLKWRAAFFIPEHVKMLGEARRDDLKVAKSILGDYQIEEFDQKMRLAMEYTYQIKMKIWEDGFAQEYIGILHRLDEFNKVIYLDTEDENRIKLSFNDVIGVEVVDG